MVFIAEILNQIQTARVFSLKNQQAEGVSTSVIDKTFSGSGNNS